jgi:hypothetical protein
MASALALGDGLRLRSRRVRSGRSRRLSLWVAIVVMGAVGAAGFARVQMRTPAEPVTVVDAATPDQQRYATEMRPIQTEIQRGISDTGLAVATYQSGGMDKAELQRRLASVLASYGDATAQLDAVDPPLPMRSSVQAYRDLLGTLSQSGAQLSKAYDDGDEGRVSAALALSLQATAQWHDLAQVGPSANT